MNLNYFEQENAVFRGNVLIDSNLAVKVTSKSIQKHSGHLSRQLGVVQAIQRKCV